MAVTAVKKEEPDSEPAGVNSLTAAESAMAERKAGQSITTLGNDAFPQVGLIGALGWVMARRQDTRITYERYMDTHTVDQIAKDLHLTGDDADPEAEAGGEP